MHDFYGVVDVNPWGLLVIVFAFVVAFRLFHCLLFIHSVSPKISIQKIILKYICVSNKHARVGF